MPPSPTSWRLLDCIRNVRCGDLGDHRSLRRLLPRNLTSGFDAKPALLLPQRALRFSSEALIQQFYGLLRDLLPVQPRHAKRLGPTQLACRIQETAALRFGAMQQLRRSDRATSQANPRAADRLGLIAGTRYTSEKRYAAGCAHLSLPASELHAAPAMFHPD